MVGVGETAAIALLCATALSAAPEPEPGAADVPITGAASPDAARRERPPSVPDDDALVAAGAVVGDVVVHVLDIFDPSQPEEDHWPYRWANALHVRTREGVVRRVLLFRSGEPYVPSRLAESERLLRQTGYLFDAWIRPIRYDGKTVDVEVTTRDVWTLTLGISFGRSGGENRTRIGIEDSNLFGTGKELTIRRTSTVDRTENLYRYRDPIVSRARVRFEAAYSDNSDGERYQFVAERPFYSLETRWAAGGSWLDDDRQDTLWEGGVEVARFRHRLDRVAVSAGVSKGVVSGRALRWLAGYTWQHDRFERLPSRPPTTPLPEDRLLSYPWVGFEVAPDAFVIGRNLDRLLRTEDLQLGARAFARVGLSLPAIGGDRTRAIFEAGARWARPGASDLVVLDAATSGRFSSGRLEDTVTGGVAKYYRRDFGRHVFFTAADLRWAHQLDTDHQLLIGGDTGLRGWPLRYQSGDRRALLTVEQRLYSNWDILRLINVGAAVFGDVGRAWFAGRSDLDRPWLADAGVGLRLGSSRSARGALVHLDVAWAIDAPPGVDRVQFVVRAREQF